MRAPKHRRGRRAPLLLSIALFFSALFATTLPAADPPSRLELGRRVQDLERTWLANPDAAARARAVGKVAGSIQKWFRADFLGVARGLVEAEALLRSPDGVSALDYWTGHLTLRPVDRVLAPTEELVGQFIANTLDDAWVTAPAEAELRWTIGERVVVTPLTGDAPHMFQLPLPAEARGDLSLTAEVWVEGKHRRTLEERISIVERFEERRQAIANALKKIPSSPEKTAIRGLEARLRATAVGAPLESPIAVAEELERAERWLQLLQSDENDRRAWGVGAPGSRWMRLATGRSSTPCRIQVPEMKEGETRPLVVAVHGMGGSENLFFEAHGLGLGPKLAAERGWIFAAPGGLGAIGVGAEVGAIVTALEEWLPVDPEQIFLIGHSLGAVRIVRATGAEPTRFRAIAPLSGGGAVPGDVDLAGLPAFLAAGDQDFGRGMTMSLESTLRQAGATVTSKIYAPSEHMLMVADSLPDVFRFFDEAVKTSAKPSQPGREL